MSRQNQWFVPGTDIAREVITADIQRYLGPDALVKPGVGTGEHVGQQGYWITAYRTLTSNMIQDLKLDSQRWQAERQPGAAGRGSGVSYQDSQTHAARQHWGPTTPYDLHAQPEYADPRRTSLSSPSPYSVNSVYANSDPHYITTSSPQYQVNPYQTSPALAVPRTTTVDPYAAYQQHQLQHQLMARADARDYTQPAYSYPSPPAMDVYGRPMTSPTNAYITQGLTSHNDYYIASDGRRYPRAQQPSMQPAPNPSSDGPRNSRYR